MDFPISVYMVLFVVNICITSKFHQILTLFGRPTTFSLLKLIN